MYQHQTSEVSVYSLNNVSRKELNKKPIQRYFFSKNLNNISLKQCLGSFLRSTTISYILHCIIKIFPFLFMLNIKK